MTNIHFTEAQLTAAFESSCDRLLKMYAENNPCKDMDEMRAVAFKCFKSGVYSLRELATLNLFEDVCYRHFAGTESAIGFASPANIFIKRDGQYILKFVELGYFCFTRARAWVPDFARPGAPFFEGEVGHVLHVGERMFFDEQGNFVIQ